MTPTASPTAPAPPARVFTIPDGLPFVDCLAAGIQDRFGSDPMTLSRVTVLLPTRRACRTLAEAFLRRSGGAPMFLPRLSPLGDVDADALEIEGVGVGDVGGELQDAVSGLRRQLLLTKAVRAADGAFATTPPQAARLAGELARLVDQVHTERLSFDRLQGLVPADYAQHWQETLTFLGIVTRHWPLILAEEGAVDPTVRRNALLDALARVWRAAPPPDPVIAAGSTGSMPAVADLLATLARLANGWVVLPGLDRAADPASWAAIGEDEAHPQHELFRLLRRLEVEREAVGLWNAPDEVRRARLTVIGEALRPAATTEAWRSLPPPPADALDGLWRIDAAAPEEEATVIALLMREALETPGRTAALLTLDRNLARRVAMGLRRWGIEVDDSAGRPLADTAVGSYLRLSADIAATRAHPLSLLALAKHPLSAGGRSPSDFRAAARALERVVLRGPRPGDGFAGLRTALAAIEDERLEHPDQRVFLTRFVEGWEALAAPLLRLVEGEAPLADFVRTHMALAEALAASDAETGAARLWRHDDGEEAARFVHELLEAAGDFPAIPGAAYPELLHTLMAGRSVRPSYGLHPRLAILGPQEARLQHFDRMILGGLNEGTWPPDAGADPWMSRPMRQAFGLEAPERAVGRAAHDFVQACGAPEVVLTRAERVDGAPTVPSRWLTRLETVLEAVGRRGALEGEGEHWLAWARALDDPGTVQPVAAPEPRPPVAARPRQLSVTEIETWMRDPYAIYARHVLRLRSLEPIAGDPGAAERGRVIHQALDAFITAWPLALPEDALDRLLACGRAAFAPHIASHPDVEAFWWPRFERVALWFIALERARRPRLRPVASEVRGRMVLDGPAGPFTLIAKADRIDIDTVDGGLMVIDYKTGTPPPWRELALGFAPQLPLEALIAVSGGFKGVAGGAVSGLAFWRLSGGDPAGEELVRQGDATAWAEAARIGLGRLIHAFDDPATPYRACPRPAMAPVFNDYAHLARILEWSAGASGGGGEG